MATTTAPSNAAQARGELALGSAVHAARRLVEEDRHGRLAAVEHDRERQPLALAAGEVARMAVGERGEADALERVGEASSPTVSCRR